MKVFTFILVSALSVLVSGYGPQYDLRDAPYLFLNFVRDYNRQYEDAEDVIRHYATFVRNLDVINEKNEAEDSARFDINEFADLSPKEFKKHTGFVPPSPPKRNSRDEYIIKTLPGYPIKPHYFRDPRIGSRP